MALAKFLVLPLCGKSSIALWRLWRADLCNIATRVSTSNRSDWHFDMPPEYLRRNFWSWSLRHNGQNRLAWCAAFGLVIAFINWLVHARIPQFRRHPKWSDVIVKGWWLVSSPKCGVMHRSLGDVHVDTTLSLSSRQTFKKPLDISQYHRLFITCRSPAEWFYAQGGLPSRWSCLLRRPRNHLVTSVAASNSPRKRQSLSIIGRGIQSASNVKKDFLVWQNCKTIDKLQNIGIVASVIFTSSWDTGRTRKPGYRCGSRAI